mmetsp:Transcript_29554/g.83049  ORF Transcript_29554/g.83049 Transcript_29554/m.83049 type:complete len:137 (+) Transcript_29554:554-964(+)
MTSFVTCRLAPPSPLHMSTSSLSEFSKPRVKIRAVPALPSGCRGTATIPGALGVARTCICGGSGVHSAAFALAGGDPDGGGGFFVRCTDAGGSDMGCLESAAAGSTVAVGAVSAASADAGARRGAGSAGSGTASGR